MSLKDKLLTFFSNKVNIALSIALLLLVVGGFLGYRMIAGSRAAQEAPLEEIAMSFDPEGPYALLFPRRDGNALVLNIKRVSSYDSISYELAYQSEGIDRGVQGKIDTKSKKNEYSQEILFGTCSTVDTYSIKNCVFDKNIEYGTLILRIQQGNKIYKMNTQWRFQKPDVALGVIASGDNQFTYKTSDSSKNDLVTIGYSIVNDLSGAPKYPEGKVALGKVYGFNIPDAKTYPPGEVIIETVENIPSDAKLARYIEGENAWELIDSKIEGPKIFGNAKSSGIFAILVNNPTK